MMHPVVKQNWVKALRSGKYRQTDSVLRCEDSYCVLGVLTDLAVKDNVCSWSYLPRDPDYVKGVMGVEIDYDVVESEALPNTVRLWAELDDPNPEVYLSEGPYTSLEEYPYKTYNGSHMSTLSRLNDDEYSFETLANLIEEQL